MTTLYYKITAIHIHYTPILYIEDFIMMLYLEKHHCF